MAYYNTKNRKKHQAYFRLYIKMIYQARILQFPYHF
jgi:hypothetical protein